MVYVQHNIILILNYVLLSEIENESVCSAKIILVLQKIVHISFYFIEHL